jgi:hypothetical protein
MRAVVTRVVERGVGVIAATADRVLVGLVTHTARHCSTL